MKLSKIFLIIGILLFSIVSCKESLELDNPNELSDATFFKRPEQLQSAVDAIYANLQTEALFARVWYYMYDNLAHEVEVNPQHEANKVVFFDYNYNAEDTYIFQYWDNCFRGINKANFVIQNENNFENVSQDLIDKSVGEAKFMRAYYYSMLVARFGGVPLYIEPTGEGQPRASEAEVYEQIYADLIDASDKLSSPSNTDGGRPSAGAALGLLGKMYLHQGRWADAKTAFEGMSGYALVSDYENNFLEESEFNIESVWELNFTLAFGATTDWSGVATGTGIHEYTFRGQDMGWNDWFNSYPSQDLVDEYEANDPRLNANFYFNGDMFNSGSEVVAIPLERTVAWKKYQLYYKQPNENQASGINCRVIRYADVLLMRAEAENELNNLQPAIDLLNEVRDRVGMPNYGTPAMNSTYPVSNKQEVFEAIVHERRVELAGEQVRFDDLVRWDRADAELAQFGFTKGVHERFPIPFQEINTNPNISASDQNAGF